MWFYSCLSQKLVCIDVSFFIMWQTSCISRMNMSLQFHGVCAQGVLEDPPIPTISDAPHHYK
jgi:hypothetical protein